MVTPSEGFEITGLPFMYPYWNRLSSDGDIRVIDAENHYYSEKHTGASNSDVPRNIVDSPIICAFADFPAGEPPSSGNSVWYNFTHSSGTSDDEEPEQPIIAPSNPGSDVGPISEFDPTTT